MLAGPLYHCYGKPSFELDDLTVMEFLHMRREAVATFGDPEHGVGPEPPPSGSQTREENGRRVTVTRTSFHVARESPFRAQTREKGG